MVFDGLDDVSNMCYTYIVDNFPALFTKTEKWAKF